MRRVVNDDNLEVFEQLCGEPVYRFGQQLQPAVRWKDNADVRTAHAQTGPGMRAGAASAVQVSVADAQMRWAGIGYGRCSDGIGAMTGWQTTSVRPWPPWLDR